MYAVTIEVPFCYGHRLVGHTGRCRHIHGHNGVAKITVTAGPLDALGMVCDFKDLKAVAKGWIDKNWDHNFIANKNDPLFGLDRTAFALVFGDREPYKLDYNPTAENMARYLAMALTAAPGYYDLGVKIVSVEIYETGSSSASWMED